MVRLLRRELLAALLGLFLGVASGASLTKHRHAAAHSQQTAVDAAADEDAQAVIEAAEKGSQAPTGEAQVAQLSVTASSAEAAQKKEEGSDDEEDSEDEDDDEDEEKSTGAPGSMVPIEKNPGEKKTLHVTYGVNDGVLRGESLTPQGSLSKARQRLQDNLYQQTKINSLIWQMQNETTFQGQVDEEAQALANETQAQALATMLGGMRKEMRKFASPFFLDHLYTERERLKKAETELQAQLETAEGGMGGGHQGWPHPGDKVVVAESVYRRPSALRGSEESGGEQSESQAKELKVSIPKDASLAQMKSQPKGQPEKSAALTASPGGAMLTVAAALASRLLF